MRLSIFAAALLLATPALAQQPAGNADNGKKLFEKVGCWQCHGLVGQGSLLSGPRISRTALPLDAFTQQLRSPSNDMPPYEAAVLPEAGVADIYFLRFAESEYELLFCSAWIGV